MIPLFHLCVSFLHKSLERGEVNVGEVFDVQTGDTVFVFAYFFEECAIIFKAWHDVDREIAFARRERS